MVNKIGLFLLSFSFLWSFDRIPDQFTVVERFLSLTSTFDIGSDFGSVATARKRLFSLTPAFDLVDSQGAPLAFARTRFFAWGTTADVEDPEGRPIGKIDEVLWRIFPWAEYKVYDSAGSLAAIARMNLWGTHFELFPSDAPSHIYATIHRPFIRCFRDHWTVQVRDFPVFEEGRIDPRLLIMLAIIQTDKDNRDRIRKEALDQLENERENFNTFDR